MKSKFLTLNWADIFKGLIVAVITAVFASFAQMLEVWVDNPADPFPINKVNLILSLNVALAAGGSYLLKNLLTGTANPIQSEFFKINWLDFFKGVGVAFITALMTALSQLVDAWSSNPAGGFPINKVSLIVCLKFALAGGVSYILKNWFTNSNGQIAKKES